MPKKIDLTHLIGRRSYNTRELADATRVHPQTVREWRACGLLPVDPDDHYSLYMGSDVKRFHIKRRQSHKVKLAEDEMYCLSCKRATVGTDVVTVDSGVKIGNGQPSMHYEAKCSVCGCEVRKYFPKANILVEGKGISIAPSSPLYRSLLSEEELYVGKNRSTSKK